MKISTEYIVITDIGSTTTKALLIDNREALPKMLGISQSPTTVEAPLNDVRHGIRSSVENLERQLGVRLLQNNTGADQLAFAENVSYFSTSSAGGGLQILVIGLTMFDSASSGKRCAYGAGGVILDTFAVDDKRQAMEQMLAMRNLHPDMILLCGGTDGGAVSGVLRMAEIVRIANPAPKFSTSSKIPAIYAGNSEAAPVIQRLVSEAFDLYILPNIRPTLEAENLEPTQAKIQQLFMENVMEHAPGYAKVKQLVSADIIPTPLGVQRSLALASPDKARNIFAFDIGGATTDVFSFIKGHQQRTVSANLGMSYSAWNVLRECGIANLLRWLPEDCTETLVRNYIANKCLNPASNPVSALQFRIEQALAREALSMALEQHRLMHYNTSKIGFLDKLKRGDVDKYEMIFEYQQKDAVYSFRESEIDVLVGAGGAFAHAQNDAQRCLILIDAIRPKGITELWFDRDFTSPHLGVLSAADPDTAKSILEKDCLSKLAIHIAPLFSPKYKKQLLQIEVGDSRGKTLIQVFPDQFLLIPEGKKTLTLKTLYNEGKTDTPLAQTLSTLLPVIVDSRRDPSKQRLEAERVLHPYLADPADVELPADTPQLPERKTGAWLKTVELPYSGDIVYAPGDKVVPDDIVAINRYNPPRLYIVDGYSVFKELTAQIVAASILVKVGDTLDFDQVYCEIAPNVELPHDLRRFRKLVSPVRGKIEYIDPNTGIMVLSEIQNYSSKPVSVDYATKLMLPPKKAKRYLTRQEGDFVFHNEVLARRLERTADGAPSAFVKAPSTGTITSIDTEKGLLTIAYIHQPMEFQAQVQGSVTGVVPAQSITIGYQGTHYEGKIAFGRECHGAFRLVASPELLLSADCRDCIVALGFAPSAQNLKDLAKQQARGVVCYNIDALELVRYLDFEPGVINTGNENLPLAVLILGGFGTAPLPQSLLRDLESYSTCYLNPHTRIRAGVVRPFISF